MTAQEQAKDLVNKFYCQTDNIGLLICPNYSNAKKCAEIAVEQIIQAIYWNDYETSVGHYNYWQQVKTEIEKL